MPKRGGPPTIHVVRMGREEMLQEALFKDDAEVQDWIRKVADDIGVDWTEQNPIADLWLPDGSRINAVGHGVSPFGSTATVVTIRKSPVTVKPVPMERMVELETLTDEIADFLVNAGVRGRLNMAFVGATDTGKTTFMRSCAKHIDARDHTAIVETSFELYLSHLTNCANFVEVHRSGEAIVDSALISRALLRQNFRRAIYGEIRGAEIVPAFDEMQSIAGGCMTSFHALDLHAFKHRVRTAFQDAGQSLRPDEVDETIRATFRVVVVLGKDREDKRRVLDVYEVHPEEGFRSLFTLDRQSLEHKRVQPVSRSLADAIVFAGGELREDMKP